ncbi:MAG: 50S ribosomal protein L32 [Chloroflexi bacterium]|nr:50S ribosomal protein L32 [Chloroflexota bacterium]
MPPLPKRKYAKARQGDRRRHLHIQLPALTACAHCHQPVPPYQVCPSCGYYRDQQIVPQKPGQAR